MARFMKNLSLPLFVALHSAGCAVIMPLDSLQVDQETTQSIPAQGTQLSPALADEDWRRAQSALSLAVDPQGPGQPVNWDNPATKKRGTFAAAGNLTLTDNTICRRFTSNLVDLSKPSAPVELRHEGQACRLGPSEWVMRDVRPLGAQSAQADQQMRAQADKQIRAQPMPLASRTSARP
jgi:surface antigen